MEIYNKLGSPLKDTNIVNHKTSFEEKKSKNWEWLKEQIDYHADNVFNYEDTEEVEKILLNFRLWNGRGVYKTDISSPFNSKEIEEEGFYFNNEDIPHFDIITPIGKSLYGQQQLMDLKPIVTDSSLSNVNFKMKKRLELYQDYINETIIQPIKEQAYQEWLIENNISDPQTLNEDMQKKMQQDIEQKTALKTPKDIERFMSSEYKSPRETLLTKLTNFLVKRDKLKFWTDENFKMMIISGKQIYETGIRNNNAHFRICNPVGYRSGGSDDAFFEEDMDWQVYRENISLATLFKDHGAEITNEHIKMLKDYDSTLSKNRNTGEFPEPMNSKIAEFDSETNFFDDFPKWSSREGQATLLGLHIKFGNLSNIEKIFERTTVVFKSLRKFKLVERWDEEDKRFKQFWVDGSYTKNPKKDFNVQTVWFPHAYMGRRVSLGAADTDMYFDLGPVPNQYKNVMEPWNITMPFMGVAYSRVFNNTPNIAPMDLAKPWQDKFNMKMAFIQEKEATDIGQIFTVANTLKPKDWSYGKWLMMARYGKLLPLDTSNELMNGVDAQMFKSYNLSQLQDIAGHLQHLEFIRNQAALAMSYNPQRLGQIVPTEAVRNAQGNINQSTYQTQDLFTLHNEVVERLLNRHMWNAKIAFKDNEYVTSYVLDDMSLTDLKIDKETLDDAEIGIFIRNFSEDYKQLELIKNLGQAMIQNQMITFPELIRLYMAKNMADAINIAERAEEKMMQRQQEAQAAQAEQAKQIEQMKQEMQKLAQEFEANENQLDRQSNEFREKIRALTMANQMDIDKDGQSDLVKIKEMDMSDSEKERDLKRYLEEKKIETDLEKAKISASAKSKSK